MIKVLQNWEEIGRAAKFIERKGLPRHGSTEKCWDYFQLYELIKDRQRSAPVLDMGCSGVHTLAFLHRMGFRDLAGLDLHITLLDRLLQTGRMWRERTWRRPFRLYRGDLTKTSFGIFDLESWSYEVVRLEYDIQKTVAAIKKAGLLPILGKRLVSGY